MTLRDMLEYLHHTQTISVKCRQTTRAVIIYIGCDRKLLSRFSVFNSGVQPLELHRKTDHLFGDVNRSAPWIGAGAGTRAYTSLRSLEIILPLYYSTILTSTFATVYSHIPSYETIHGRMPLQCGDGDGDDGCHGLTGHGEGVCCCVP